MKRTALRDVYNRDPDTEALTHIPFHWSTVPGESDHAFLTRYSWQNCTEAGDRALTVFLEHHVHICNGAQRKGCLRVSQAVDVLRDLLQLLVQLDGLAQAFLPANVPACIYENSGVDHCLCLYR